MTADVVALTKRGTPRQRKYVAVRAKRCASDRERIELHSKVDDHGCWVWQITCDANGYGRMTVAGAAGLYAHRVAYEAFVGPIPDGLTLDHLCRNTSCCNPAHLEPVTMRENTLRGFGFAAQNARKTHCPSGHAYDEANTYHCGGRRYCRACAATRRGR